MYLVPLLDHLRRNARCLVVVTLALTGAFLLPTQVSAAGAAERVAATSAAPASPVVPVPEPTPTERLKPIPAEPVCPPAVATCEDLTIDPCIEQQDCEPPPPPCEEGVLSRNCPQPPCDLEEEEDQEHRLSCPPPCEEDPEQECPVPPCDPEDYPRLREIPENPDHPWNPDCPVPPCDWEDYTEEKPVEKKRLEEYPECPPCDWEVYPEYEEKQLEEKPVKAYPECPPPHECEKGDHECEPPDETWEPDPGVDRPVPGTPTFTG
jgi:hypothetical protein